MTSSTTPTTSTSTAYDITGNVTTPTVNGVSSTVTTTSATNYAAPYQITTNTLTSTMTWSPFLGLGSATGPNGDSGSISYDGNARPSTTVSPYGAVTTYAYNDTASPPNKIATTNGHWVKTVMDGFGRAIQTITGNGGTTVSTVDVQYAPCGCSPLGKLSRQSAPYAPGGSDAWTTYNYDASGRTLSVVLPDTNNSTTKYSYQGNQVTITDAANNSKTFTMDALGNLTSVLEFDPTLSTNVTTSYTYDVLNHLTGVSMPRGTTTQTRTFNYTTSNVVGAFLLSATNPENGTVIYTYNPTSNTLATKTDAKNQQLTYQYDTYNRLTSLTWVNSPAGSQVLRTYYYDTNPLDSTGFSQYALGRLAAVQYAPFPLSTVPDTAGPISLVDMYSYTQAGLPAAKRLQVNEVLAWKNNQGYNQGGTGTDNLDSTYTYNNEGKVTAMTYPTTTPGYTSGVAYNVPGASYNYSYDSMYRLGGMTTSGGTTVVNGVSYNAANQLLGMTYNSIAETRGYNVLNQLTSLSAQENATTVENLTYNYPTGTNNGKISYMSNALSGEKISYTYDSLNRMIAASDSIGQTVQWAEGYTFDPFGNLTAKAVTGGTQGGPSLSVAISQVNNQIETYYYDANGNGLYGNATAYDVENHVSGGGWSNGAPVVDYGYDAQSRRFLVLTAGTVDSYGNANNYLVAEYSPSGQKLATYQINTCNDSSTNQPVLTVCSTLSTSDQYFGGRRLAVMDQLGSAGTYYPWGEAKGSTNPQDTWSFATYWRDSATGLDYANNRYYSNAYGRFMTPDPYSNSGRLGDPGSWNRYVYTRGDPVNRLDQTGTDDCDTAWESDASMVGTPCGAPNYGGLAGYFPDIAAIVTAAVAGALGGSSGGAPQSSQPSQLQLDKCHIEIRYSQIVIDGTTTPVYHTMLVGIDDTTGLTLGVIDGWPSLGFINLPPPITPIPITKLTTGESQNGHYNNANTSTPYVDTNSTTAMCAAWAFLVALADNFPNAIYGGLTSNSNSLTTFLWGLLGQPTIGPPPVPTPGWNGPIFWVP